MSNITRDQIRAIVRESGYCTNRQSDEIADSIAAALAATPQQPAQAPLDPNKIQLCRVGKHGQDAQAMGQPCNCPAATCRLCDGGLRWPGTDRPVQAPEGEPAQAPVLSEADERAAFEAWAQREYRNADEYTKRDYTMGLDAWQARAILSTNPKSEPAASDRDARDAATEAAGVLTFAARDVLLERERQITAEGWTPEHDDEHDVGELAQAAAFYAMAGVSYERGRVVWPWDEAWLKVGDRRRNLVKAGALILAEIERLDRAAAKEAK